jgi:Domain of unknown function (DUF4397)
MRKFLVLAVLLVVVMAIGVSTVGASGVARIYVVHGIPGKDIQALGLAVADSLPVDVSVDGTCVLNDFTFGSIVGPVSLPVTGVTSFNFKVFLADPANRCNPANQVLDRSFFLGPGEVANVVAHLNTAGLPNLQKFSNFVQRPARGEARLIVHHVANAPAVDISLRRGGQSIATITNLENAEVVYSQPTADLRARNYNLRIFAAGTNTRVFGPALLQLVPRQVYLVFAVGSLENGTFRLLTTGIY